MHCTHKKKIISVKSVLELGVVVSGDQKEYLFSDRPGQTDVLYASE